MNPTPVEPVWVRNRKACFAICNAFSLNRGDRLELASVLFDRNVNSWNDLDSVELGRLRDALEGATLVATFQMERRRGLRQ